MNVSTYKLSVEVFGTQENTYEIRRSWNEKGKAALMIALYPTIGINEAGKTDLSTMHLMNHAEEMKLGSISICNLYSRIFKLKPSVKELSLDDKNLSYIEEIALKGDFDHIICSWGSSHSTHRTTQEAKLRLLTFFKDKKLDKKLRHILSETIELDEATALHPLYLGLHSSREKWSLEEFPTDKVIAGLKAVLPDTPKALPADEKGRKTKNRKEADSSVLSV
jgi:hypothetical protein